MATIQEQKNEAIARLKMLKVHNNVINEFKNDNLLNQSIHGGILYWLDEKEQEFVNDFEKKTHCVVYHIIHNYTDIGELLSLLFVSENENEWIQDRLDLQDGYAFVYVKNLSDDYCSEYGTIGIAPRFGGLMRTC